MIQFANYGLVHYTQPDEDLEFLGHAPPGWERYAVGMSALAIEKMSWDEKLRTMEELWESLSRDEARLESPPWHQEALRETLARHDAGKEQQIDWDAAKRELRKRAE